MKKILTLILLFSIFPCFAKDFVQKEKDDMQLKLWNELSKTKTPEDSIKILYDIFDSAYHKDEIKIGRMLYDTAKRIGREDVQLDVLRLLVAEAVKSDSLFNVFMEAAESIPDSREKKETILYLKIRQISWKAAYASVKERHKNIVQIINEYNQNNKEDDQYEELLKLFTLCAYIKNEVTGDLLVEYLDDMKKLLTESDLELYAFNTLFYTQAANIYTATGNMKKAIDADKMQLKLIKELEKDYKEKGRHHREYSRHYFICYRRLLSNYEALSPAELEDYYAKAKYLIATDKDIRESHKTEPRVDIYYNMAKGNYTQAIPFIYRQLEVEKNLDSRKRLFDMLEEAAEKSGDQAAKVTALEGKNEMILAYDAMKASEKYKELQIRYEVSKLQSKNDKLELQRRQDEVRTTRKIMGMVLVGWIIFGIILAVLVFFYIRARRASLKIAPFISDIIDERNRLKGIYYNRTPFGGGESLSDDTADKLNGEKSTVSLLDPHLINKMINNLLFVASIGKEDCDRNIVSTSIFTLMRKSVNEVASSVGPAVEIKQDFPEEDVEFFTDEPAAQKILEGLLTFSVRNSHNGKITLSGMLDGDNKIKFVLTDQGNRIAPGLEHSVFRNFLSFENLPEGSRLISICRQIALLLKGGVHVDTSYKDGARIIITFPVNLER